jgi:putative transposase
MRLCMLIQLGPRKRSFKGDRLLYLAWKMLVRVPSAPMPRIPRGQVAGYAYHVLNRGNGGMTVFHKDGDYSAFLDLLAKAKTKFSVRVLAVCLMPNHFHLVV